jgi:hypothetical protein
MDGWPGIFRTLRHQVDDDAPTWQLQGRYAARLHLSGLWVTVAICGAPCWPPSDSTTELAWCPTCQRARALTWSVPLTPR